MLLRTLGSAEIERCEQERLGATPAAARGAFRLRAVREVLADLEQFFSADAGLAVLCRRINRRTREAIRRLQRHVEAVRLRNVRTEAIRARVGELLRLPDGEAGDRAARDFLEELVAPVLSRTDARAGTPERRAAPPRPARRYESLRPVFRGEALEEKRSTPEASRELERRRLARYSRFVEERILRGRERAALSEAQLDELPHARLLVGAVAAWFLRGGRARRHITYRMSDPGTRARAALETESFTLDVRELDVERAARTEDGARST